MNLGALKEGMTFRVEPVDFSISFDLTSTIFIIIDRHTWRYYEFEILDLDSQPGFSEVKVTFDGDAEPIGTFLFSDDNFNNENFLIIHFNDEGDDYIRDNDPMICNCDFKTVLMRYGCQCGCIEEERKVRNEAV